MQIKLNSANEILYYAPNTPTFDDMTAVDDSIVPENFKTDFKKGYFKFENGTITVNSNYTSPSLPTGPRESDTDKAIAELIKSNAQQRALNAQLIKQLSTLQTSQATQTAQTAQAVQAAQTQTTQEAE